MTVRSPFFAALCCMFGPVAGAALLFNNIPPLLVWLFATLVAVLLGKEVSHAAG